MTNQKQNSEDKDKYIKLLESQINMINEINKLNIDKVNKYKFYAILGWSLLIFISGTFFIFLTYGIH